MPQEKSAFREGAIELISDMAQHLPLDCELLVVACRPGKKDFDLVLPSPESNLNNALDALRRNGLSIDGDNAYKRDLCDSIVGALAFGAQNRNPPQPGHWGQKFWEIGREERALTEEMLAALQAARDLWGDYLPPGNSNAMKAMRLVDAAIAKATQ
ncbi:hypothetical protein [Pseudomonas fluorescens]|uniref:hypothetical protein n=1 Tax=Pseudomonas fluorescens TaxID=294 RepID=UPI000641F423|nr:hypothetical protein [Pseudomonas fluorescens]